MKALRKLFSLTQASTTKASATTTKKKPDILRRCLTRIATALGFSKVYNFLLYFVFAGALLGFTLARLQYLSYHGIFCGGGSGGAAPGECYYYTRDHYKIGMMLHLFCILPAGLLAILQFVPLIRRKVILFHRINGYVVVLLVLVSIAGALMVARVAFGGTIDTQTVVGLLSILTVGSLVISYVSIKRLRIDQHRAWMLRAWFYLGTIITTRIIMIIATTIISANGTYYTARPCAQLQSTMGNLLATYPECAGFVNGTNPNQRALVHANFSGRPEEVGASLGIPFGMALWLSLAIHAIGVEFYLSMTPAESERLRALSVEKRIEAGLEQRKDEHVVMAW